jgi:Group II intron, maturase-specific domain
VEDLNRFLRGWAGYFRYVSSALVLGQIRNYALERLALWLSKKGNRRRAWGWGIKQVLLSPDHNGPDHPRWNRYPAQALPALARAGRTPTVKNVGKP